MSGLNQKFKTTLYLVHVWSVGMPYSIVEDFVFSPSTFIFFFFFFYLYQKKKNKKKNKNKKRKKEKEKEEWPVWA